jgi:hypothetical protein
LGYTLTRNFNRGIERQNPALATNHNEVRTGPIRLAAVWYPVMSEVRRLPELKKLVSELNLVEYWRAYGIALLNYWMNILQRRSDGRLTGFRAFQFSTPFATIRGRWHWSRNTGASSVGPS